jgi:hypothetical protein
MPIGNYFTAIQVLARFLVKYFAYTTLNTANQDFTHNAYIKQIISPQLYGFNNIIVCNTIIQLKPYIYDDII